MHLDFFIRIARRQDDIRLPVRRCYCLRRLGITWTTREHHKVLTGPNVVAGLRYRGATMRRFVMPKLMRAIRRPLDLRYSIPTVRRDDPREVRGAYAVRAWTVTDQA